MLNTLELLGILAAGVAPVSLTITLSPLFKSFRTLVLSKSKMLGTLFGCPYCVSHWLSLLAVSLFRPMLTTCPIPFPLGWLVDFFVSWFVLVTLTAPFAWVLYKSYEAMGVYEEHEE